jgi:hypothetical protein
VLLACSAAAASSMTSSTKSTRRKLDLVEVITTTTTTTRRTENSSRGSVSVAMTRPVSSGVVQGAVVSTNVFYNMVGAPTDTAMLQQRQHNDGGSIAAMFISAREQRHADEKRRLRELGRRLATTAVLGTIGEVASR